MKTLTARELQEGEEIPMGYGLSYKDHKRMVAICHPIPLNWAVRLWRYLRFRVRVPPFSSESDCYKKGYIDGLKENR